MPASFTGWNKNISTTLLILVLYTSVYGQDDKLQAEFTIASGLQSNTVRCIKIDVQGRLWNGTDNGLSIINANTPAQRKIVSTIGNKSIWAVNFLDSLAFIGTRYDGLYIFNTSTGNLYKYYSSSTINQIRKIKIFNKEVFILTNDGPYQFKKFTLSKISLTNNIAGDFVTDMFSWSNNVYGLVYPSRQIVKFANNSFEENAIELFFGKNSRLADQDFFCVTVYNNQILLGSDNNQLIIIIEVGKPAKLLSSFSSIAHGYAVWDIAVVKGKLLAAVGDTYSNTKGFLYIQNLQSENNYFKITDYLTCLEVDIANNSLYYGSINKGMFLQRNISGCVGVNMPDETNITASEKNIYFYNNAFIKKFNANGFQSNARDLINDSITSANIFGDTLIYANEKSVKLYHANSLKPIATLMKVGTLLAEEAGPRIGYLSELQLINNTVFAFMNYGGVYKYNLENHARGEIKNIESFTPRTKKFGDKIILLNQEKGFNLITENAAYPLSCSNKNIAFATDFTLIKDSLFVLIRNKVEAYLIDYKTHQLIFLKSFSIDEMLEGFTPQWITSKNNQLYILNNYGIINLSLIKEIPVQYYYFGNYYKINKPVISGDSLVLVSNTLLSKIPFSKIDGTDIHIDEKNVGLIYPESVNENLDFKITVSYPDYQVQNHFLKSLEVWKNGTLITRKFCTGDQFQFIDGMKYGDYDLVLTIGNTQIKQKLSVTLPISRNPYFFGFMLIFILTVLIIFVKSRIDKKELNKKLLENRLQILKQNLNPHFVYNSMNLISSLILEEKNEEAVEVVAEFSKLQRTYLEINNKSVISLEEELKFLEDYLKLQHRRFHLDNDFDYTINISSEINAANIMLPPLILQPLAENAINYGVISSAAPVKKIRIDVSGGNPIVIGVEDNGENIGNDKKGLGLGHKLVSERISLFSHSMNRRLHIYFDKPALHSDSGYRSEIHIHI